MKGLQNEALEGRLAALRPLFEADRRVVGVFLFGSQAQGSATPRSDIDLGVLFEGDGDLKTELALEVNARRALGGIAVDVVNLGRANQRLRFAAVRGQVIFERDPVAVSDFIEATLRAQRDFAWRRKADLHDYFHSLEQTYGTGSRPDS